MKLIKPLIAGLIAIVLASGLALSAHATPTLTLSDGTTTIMVMDNGAGDLDPILGSVLFNGAVGSNFGVQAAAGLTKPADGSASAPAIDLDGLTHALGAGTLTMTFTETDFTAFPGILTGSFSATVGAGGSATNIVMQNALDLITNGPFGAPGGFSSGSAALIDGAPYSLTETAILTFGARGGTTSFDAMASVPGVPDGGTTVTMLGIGLLAVGAAGRIYRRATV